MKTDNENELRELDAWIAEHVMGEMVAHGVLVYRHQLPSGEPEERQAGPIPEYSTSLAAAMQVLEKCYGELSICSCKTPNGFKFWLPNGFTGAIEAPTLPLAICLFAKLLFSK